MNTIMRAHLPWPAPALIALVAVAPREGQDEAWRRHLVARPDDARATLVHFFLAACGDDAGTGP